MTGFLGGFSSRINRALLDNLIAPLMHNKDYNSSVLFLSETMGLAKITSGSFQGFNEVYYNENRKLMAFIDGILLIDEKNKIFLANRGHEITEQSSDEQTVIHLFEEFGYEFPKYISGNFIVIIIDLLENTLLIANDRFGSRLIYYLTDKSDFFFAPELKSLFKLPLLSLNFNWEGIAEFLHFGHMLGDNTWFNEIKVMDPASILHYKNGKLSVHSYSLNEEIDANCEVEQIAFQWKNTVSKLIDKLQKLNLTVGIDLTGGCDTRIILASIDPKLKKDMYATTFSFPETTELNLAKQIAKTAKIDHFISELTAASLFNWARKAVYISDGMHPPTQLLVPDMLIGTIDVIIDGIGLDWFLGGLFFEDTILDSIKHNDLDRIISIFYEKPYGGVLFYNEELSKLLNLNYYKKIEQKALISTIKKFKALHSKYANLAFCVNLFLLWNRSRRYIALGSYIFRSKVERLSLADSELLFKIGLTMNPKNIAKRKLERTLLMKISPELSKIPYDATGLPIYVPYGLWQLGKIHLFMLRTLTNRLGNIKLSIATKFFAQGPNSLDDYNFLKSNSLWYNFLEDLIIGQRTLSRNFFNAKYLLCLWRDFLVGKKITKKVLAISTLELWFRILEDEHGFVLNNNGEIRHRF